MKSLQAIRTRRLAIGLVLAVGLAGVILGALWRRPEGRPLVRHSEFDGERAYEHVLAQLEFGPRIPGTEAHTAAGDYIFEQLTQFGWEAEFQPFTYQNTPVRNIIARANVGRGPIILIGAHYDTRRRADQDPRQPDQPVPGANDGASGVAVLLELAAALNLERVPNEIWLVFFDAEDNGDLDGWEWIVGSTYMAARLNVQPQAMILVDMVGDQDQKFYFEANSDRDLSAQIWATAAELGYGDHFLPVARWAILDDHIPFLRRGIPSLDIIDFDYPYWHTVDDTADKVEAMSLERVGRTLAAFLEKEDG